MNTTLRLFSWLVLVAGVATLLRAADAGGGPVYELRVYTATPGNLDKVLARFRDHTMTIFERHGMVNVAYWTPMDEKDGAGQKLVYLLWHKSREAATASWKAFRDDPEWQQVAKASEANGKIVARTESTFLAATDFSPAVKPSAPGASSHVYELRTYTTPENATGPLDARFRGGETDLFAKAGMTGVFYTHPTDAEKGASHTLIYMLAHANRDAAKASWDKFRTDPAWVKMKADSEKPAGPLTTKTESMFLAPTDFSPLK